MGSLLILIMAGAFAGELTIGEPVAAGKRLFTVDISYDKEVLADEELVVKYVRVHPALTSRGLQDRIERKTPELANVSRNGDSWVVMMDQPSSAGAVYVLTVSHIRPMADVDRERLSDDFQAFGDTLNTNVRELAKAGKYQRKEDVVTFTLDVERADALRSALAALDGYQTDGGDAGSVWVREQADIELSDDALTLPVQSWDWLKTFDTNKNTPENFEKEQKAALDSAALSDACGKGGFLASMKLGEGELKTVTTMLKACAGSLDVGEEAEAAHKALQEAAAKVVKVGDDYVELNKARTTFRESLRLFEDKRGNTRSEAEVTSSHALSAAMNWINDWTEGERFKAEVGENFGASAAMMSDAVKVIKFTDNTELGIGDIRWTTTRVGVVYSPMLDDVMTPAMVSICPTGCMRDERAFWFSWWDFASAFAVDLGVSRGETIGTQDARVGEADEPVLMAGGSFSVLPTLNFSMGAMFYENLEEERWENDLYLGGSIDLVQAAEWLGIFGIEVPGGLEESGNSDENSPEDPS